MEITITIKITEEQIPENTLMQIYSKFWETSKRDGNRSRGKKPKRISKYY